MRIIRRWLGMSVALFFIVLCFTGITYSWQSVSQTARNDVAGEPEVGDLTIEKRIENIDGSEPTPEQKAEVFEFIVTFSDDGTYEYWIDGEGPQELTSGGSLFLKHGQIAVFEDLPTGITYRVEEVRKENYYPMGSGHSGQITTEGAYALFRNIYQFEPVGEPGKLIVKKVVTGYPWDPNKEFSFTLIIDGKETKFTLKPGEFREFEIPEGSHFEVKEEDYSSKGYITSIVNGIGIMLGNQTIECVVTNRHTVNPDIDISGEKFWILNGASETVMPQWIRVLLKIDDEVVEEKIVSADSEGRWRYTFNVPKHDENGEEILYWIEEIPIPGFDVRYDGYNITNTYLSRPIEILPDIDKQIVGENIPDQNFTFIFSGLDNAPMPQGADSQTMLINIKGSGTASIGRIRFEEPGTYVYTLQEKQWNWDNWTMDSTVYTLIYEVYEYKGIYLVNRTIKKGDEIIENNHTLDKLMSLPFVNNYKDPEAAKRDEKVTIQGEKKWSHRSNLIKNWPKSITVYIYGDGELVAEVEVTEATNWVYTYELPKYAEDGHIINYTISEKPVPGYDSEIQGYNIVNVFHIDEEETETGTTGGTTGGNSTQVGTGDRTPVTKYFIAMILSFFSIMQIVVIWIVERKRKHNGENE